MTQAGNYLPHIITSFNKFHLQKFGHENQYVDNGLPDKIFGTKQKIKK